MLLGPLSETISSVSLRACALAGEKIAGAVTAAPAAAAVDFRKSRRFIWKLPRMPFPALGEHFFKARARFRDLSGLSSNPLAVLS
jgi:hypothetical protein